MVWTYLANSKHNLRSLNENPLTFECIELDMSNKESFDKLKNGYIELINSGFFDGFSKDYNKLFISVYEPDKSPMTREKLFEIELS